MTLKEIIDASKELMLREFEEKRKKCTLSKTHDEGHCENVAVYGAATARAIMKGQNYGDRYAEQSGNLTMICGYLHDIKREKTETEPHGPASAKFFEELYQTKFNKLKYFQFALIYDAIYNHELSFGKITEIFGNPIAKRKGSMIIPTVVVHSLKTADACLEASGFRVFADRRPFFVGNERTKNGDLKTIFKYPDESHLSVLGETMIRLYGRNPIDEYPLWLKSIAEELHSIQYLGYKGLLNFVGMDEEEAAKFFVGKGFPKFDQNLADKISAEKHLDGKFFDPNKYPILTKKIEEIKGLDNNELASLSEGVNEMIYRIASTETPEIAFEKYQKERDRITNTYLRYFMDGAIAYRIRSNEDIEKFENRLREEIERLSNK
ncbi:MAG: hypothetical protein QXD48_02045 [Candidatus Aenigmatarchaeota archaeon]